MLSDNHYESALAAASELGKDHGQSAATWMFDGNTATETYRRVLDGITDGDPEVLDALPSADLSGQWADGPTPSTVAESVVNAVDGVNADDLTAETIDRLCDAYETAFNDTVTSDIERAAREHLAA